MIRNEKFIGVFDLSFSFWMSFLWSSPIHNRSYLCMVFLMFMNKQGIASNGVLNKIHTRAANLTQRFNAMCTTHRSVYRTSASTDLRIMQISCWFVFFSRGGGVHSFIGQCSGQQHLKTYESRGLNRPLYAASAAAAAAIAASYDGLYQWPHQFSSLYCIGALAHMNNGWLHGGAHVSVHNLSGKEITGSL